MSAKVIYTCDSCNKEFKTSYSGGKTHSMTYDWFEYPITHIKITDTRGDNYDFCSDACVKEMIFV